MGPCPCPTATLAPASSALAKYCLAAPVASARLIPLARNEAMADDSVHPVPCVFCVSTSGDVNVVGSCLSPVQSMSVTVPADVSRCPPLISTAFAPSPMMRLAACLALAALVTRHWAMHSASARFGVTTVASGSNCSMSAVTASSSISRLPLVAIITGSSTTCRGFHCRSLTATVSMICEFMSIPIFTASGVMSLITASIWSPTTSGVTAKMLRTPVVFCAVTAVITVMP